MVSEKKERSKTRQKNNPNRDKENKRLEEQVERNRFWKWKSGRRSFGKFA